MKQTDLDLNLTLRNTRKGKFLDERNNLVPGDALLALIDLRSSRKDQDRRPFVPEAMMFFTHSLQRWYGLSEVKMEDALFEVALYRHFAVRSRMNRRADRMSMLMFRHLLESHASVPKMLVAIYTVLAAEVLMHQARNGNKLHFGMKAYIAVDPHFGLVHPVVGTAATVNDVPQAHGLVHGEESDLFADAYYQDVERREHTHDNETEWHMALRPAKRRALDKYKPSAPLVEQLEHAKVGIRAEVDHPIRAIKRQFAYVKVCESPQFNRNTAQMHTLFALSNARSHAMSESATCDVGVHATPTSLRWSAQQKKSWKSSQRYQEPGLDNIRRSHSSVLNTHSNPHTYK